MGVGIWMSDGGMAMKKMVRLFLVGWLLTMGATLIGWARDVDRETADQVIYGVFKDFIDKYPKKQS